MRNIYFDESGIHKEKDHSTFALVYIESDDILVLENKILKLEADLKINFFHWSETAWKVKEKFLNKSLSFKFRVKVAVVKNPINTSKEILRLLPHLIIEKDIYRVVIDGKKPRWYERAFKNVLRIKGVSIKKLKTVKSEKEPIIRLADMVAGLVRSYFDGDNKVRVEKYYKRLRNKMEILVQ